MEKSLEISLLMDYYGSLLTKKQQAIMGLYYDEDFSLGEIAEINQTSRQAIHDLIKRTYRQLRKYEDHLGMKAASEAREIKKSRLVERLADQKGLSADIKALIESI